MKNYEETKKRYKQIINKIEIKKKIIENNQKKIEHEKENKNKLNIIALDKYEIKFYDQVSKEEKEKKEKLRKLRTKYDTYQLEEKEKNDVYKDRLKDINKEINDKIKEISDLKKILNEKTNVASSINDKINKIYEDIQIQQKNEKIEENKNEIIETESSKKKKDRSKSPKNTTQKKKYVYKSMDQTQREMIDEIINKNNKDNLFITNIGSNINNNTLINDKINEINRLIKM